MTPSLAEATAAARRVQEPYGQSYASHMDDARLLAAFVLAGDTERLREALERIMHLPYSVTGDAESDLRAVKDIAQAALQAEGSP